MADDVTLHRAGPWIATHAPRGLRWIGRMMIRRQVVKAMRGLSPMERHALFQQMERDLTPTQRTAPDAG